MLEDVMKNPCFSSMADRRRGFTLIELLTVIAIIGILAGILIPVVGRVRESARNSACLSNLRQIGTAFHLHANDRDGTFPPSQRATSDIYPAGSIWSIEIHPYLDGRDIAPNGGIPTPPQWLSGTSGALICPSHENTPAYQNEPWKTGYAMNYRLYSPDMPLSNNDNGVATTWRIGIIEDSRIPTSRKILVADHHEFQFQVTQFGLLNSHVGAIRHFRRHNDGNSSNYLFIDGSVRNIPSTAEALYTYFYQNAP
jgi:prepilin-type N-terminal cleavage/methylation domain-containing protein/prepilin-type processing-associated H-X9-DG protein